MLLENKDLINEGMLNTKQNQPSPQTNQSLQTKTSFIQLHFFFLFLFSFFFGFFLNVNSSIWKNLKIKQQLGNICIHHQAWPIETYHPMKHTPSLLPSPPSQSYNPKNFFLSHFFVLYDWNSYICFICKEML